MTRFDIVRIEIFTWKSFYDLIQKMDADSPVEVVYKKHDGDSRRLRHYNYDNYRLTRIDDEYEAYINEVKLKISNKIDNLKEIGVKEIANTFILDLFKAFPSLQYYAWDRECRYHRKDHQYGRPHGSYMRTEKYPDVICIDDSPQCCNYSGTTSFYDIKRDKHIYGSCGCFFSEKAAEEALHEYVCEEEDE